MLHSAEYTSVKLTNRLYIRGVIGNFKRRTCRKGGVIGNFEMNLPETRPVELAGPLRHFTGKATPPVREAGLSSMWLSSVPYWRRFARNYGTTNARFYSSDFGSDLFIGDLVLSRESSSCAQAGTPTLPSRMISFALSFLP